MRFEYVHVLFWSRSLIHKLSCPQGLSFQVIKKIMTLFLLGAFTFEVFRGVPMVPKPWLYSRREPPCAAFISLRCICRDQELLVNGNFHVQDLFNKCISKLNDRHKEIAKLKHVHVFVHFVTAYIRWNNLIQE